MKLFLAACCLAAALCGQTLVQDNLRSPINGRAFNGTVSVAATFPMLCGGVAYGNDFVPIRINGGAFSISLIANSLCTPAGTTYTVRFVPDQGSSWSEYWTVPDIGTPVPLGAITRSTVQPPPPSLSAPTWGGIVGILAAQADLLAALGSKQPLLTSSVDIAVHTVQTGDGTLDGSEAICQSAGHGGACVTITAPAALGTCNSSTRMNFSFVLGAGGVKDAVSICAKDSSNVYAWRTIY